MRRILMLGAVTAALVLAVGVRLHAQTRPQIILFQEDNYRGNQYPVDGPVDRLRFDDRASSVRVLSGRWELCDDTAFRGRCVIVDRDVPKLDALGMDDRISSLRPAEAQRDNTPRNERRDNFRDRRDDLRDRRSGGGDDSIRVVAGTYGGGTCRQPHGNRTADLAAACDGQNTCRYNIDVRVIGDPAFGCAKDYVAEWSCGRDRSVRQSRITPEADRQTVVLDCR